MGHNQRSTTLDDLKQLLTDSQPAEPPDATNQGGITINGGNTGTINLGTIVYGESAGQPPDDDDAWRNQVQTQLNANSHHLQEILNALATPMPDSQTKRRKSPNPAKLANQSTTAESLRTPLQPTCDLTVIATALAATRTAINNTATTCQALTRTRLHQWRQTARNAANTAFTAARAIIYAPTRCIAAMQSTAANMPPEFFFARPTTQTKMLFSSAASPGQSRHLPPSQTMCPLTPAE